MNGRAYYNEIDPFAAAWLRELIADGLVPTGDVDERSIVDVEPVDLRGYAACHWFAGIGGWAYGLRLAGWPDDRSVWTGSCPCQPLSSAGKRSGHLDERHLWPAFHRLIAECSPPVVFGEQVASKDGREWFAAVRTDLEALGYACGGADLCAAGVGAPHIRQRLFWIADRVADAGHERYESFGRGVHGVSFCPSTVGNDHFQPQSCGGAVSVADGLGARLEGSDARALGHEREAAERGGAAGAVVDAEMHSSRPRQQSTEPTASWRPESGRSNPWSNIEWLPCRDGKARPAQPGIQPLAHGISNRVGTLRGAGNAIVPQVAAEFIKAVMDVRPSISPTHPTGHAPVGEAG